MSELRIQQYSVVTAEGQTVQLEYDQDGDMLEIFFEQGPANGAIELADPFALRFARETGKALSLSILTFSQIIQGTELGPRSFQLYGPKSLPDTLKEMVIKMITSPPVSHFLKVVVYYPKTEQPPIPISYVERSVALPVTA
jgi:YD repeat-containing protein